MKRDVLKRAALFSALTGLRHCDIQKLKWNEIAIEGNQVKTSLYSEKDKRGGVYAHLRAGF